MGKVKVNALNGVDIQINRGDFVAIMGPSGSGKSTLMHILGCLDSATSGQYFLDSNEVSNLKKRKLSSIRNKKIGFVFQTFNLLPHLNIMKNVELPLMYSGFSKRKRREMAKQVLTEVGLQDRLKHKPSELSGGQRQRVAIARALVNDPAIILADEPTGNLDSTRSLEIMDLLSLLNREKGLTIVMVTHEQDMAAYAKTRVRFVDGLIAESWPEGV